MTRDDSRDDWAQQGKQFVSDLRDTVGKKVADNEDNLRGGLGKAARWIDQKTGGKYAGTISKAETSVGQGIGKVAAQGGTPGATGEPQAPGASVGDPATGPVGPPVTDPATPAEGVPSPTAETSRPGPTPYGRTPYDQTPPGRTTEPIVSPTNPTATTGPVIPPNVPGPPPQAAQPPEVDDSADWPRPPQ
jgi:hypothetical protein